MRRSRIAFAAGAAMVLMGALPAQAHVSFTSEKVSKDSEEILEINVPVEQSGFNAKITVDVPAEFGALYCYAEPGWGCVTEPPSGAGGPATFTFTRTSAPPTAEDLISFGVQTPKDKGDYAFAVHQGYSTGDVVDWTGQPESPNPAAYVTVK